MNRDVCLPWSLIRSINAGPGSLSRGEENSRQVPQLCPRCPKFFFALRACLPWSLARSFFVMAPLPWETEASPPAGSRPSTLKGRGNGVPYAFSPEEHGRLNPAFERTFGAMASPVAFNPKSFTHVLFPRRLPAALVRLTNLPV